MATNLYAVLVVADGLRPDMISRAATPRMADFAQRSLRFQNACSVFPSMTRVAMSSIATGDLPARHGVVGNAMLLPEIVADRVLDFGRLDAVTAALEAGVTLVESATFADRLAAAGHSVAMVSAAGAGTAYFLNPRAAQNEQIFFALAAEAISAPPTIHRDMAARFGPIPPRSMPSVGEVDYATTVFCTHILRDIAPDVAVLWLCEPDNTFHVAGLHSPTTSNILRVVDAAVGRVLDTLQDLGREPLVLLVSDHGHLTVDRSVALRPHLEAAGFSVPDWRNARLRDGDLAYFGWTMGACHARGHEPVGELVDRLTKVPDVHVVFTRDAAGAMSLADVGLSHPRAPDVVFTLESGPQTTAKSGPWGGRGAVVEISNAPHGGGMHGGLSRAEMNATLMLSSPEVRPGTSQIPVSICDIAPSIEYALGIPADPNRAGRPLQSVQRSPARLVTRSCRSAPGEDNLTLMERDGTLLPIGVWSPQFPSG